MKLSTPHLLFLHSNLFHGIHPTIFMSFLPFDVRTQRSIMIMPMKRRKIILIALLFFVVVGFKSSIGTRLLENGFFISPQNPSGFVPKLNSVIQITGTRSDSGSGSETFKDPKEKTQKPWDEPSTLAFRFKENGMMGDKMKEVPNSEEVVLNVLVKGSLTQPGGSERGNNGIRSAQRLVKSNHSPEVGNFQIFNSPKSAQKSRVAHKRVLKSSPSPGGGH